MPSNSITYISATTRGRDFSGAISVASARPAVWVICEPAPTSKKASAELTCPSQGPKLESPDSKISANGMIAKPANCSHDPIQM